MQWYEIILIALSIGQFLAMIIGGYIFIRKPSDDATNRISRIETICPVQHLQIEEKFSLMRENILVGENHLKHIESHLYDISRDIAVILDRQLIRLEKEKNKQ
jgi:hypothetical protein